jgi:hypothetical protein
MSSKHFAQLASEKALLFLSVPVLQCCALTSPEFKQANKIVCFASDIGSQHPERCA